VSAVTDVVPGGYPSSVVSPTRVTLPEKTSEATGPANPVQPFTEVLSEQTSRASRDTAHKRESSKDAKSTSPKDGRPLSTTRKGETHASTDAAAAVLAPALLVDAPAPPNVSRVGSRLAMSAHSSTDVTAAAVQPSTTAPVMVTTGTKVEGGPEGSPHSPLETSATPHPGTSDPAPSGLITSDGESAAPPSGRAARVLTVDGSRKHVDLVERPIASTLASGPKTPTRDAVDSTVGPASLRNGDTVDGNVAQSSVPRGPAAVHADGKARQSVGKAEQTRDPLALAMSTPTESVGPPVSALIAHAQAEGSRVTSVPSSSSGSISGASASSAAATPFGAPLTSNSLDVGRMAGAISRPFVSGNGIYTVTVAMHPAELGQLQAVMSLDGNNLRVSITPQTRVGHEALVNAVDTLKNELARGGVNVNVTLRDPGFQSGGDGRDRTNVPRGESPAPENPVRLLPPAPVLTTGQIHLVL